MAKRKTPEEILRESLLSVSRAAEKTQKFKRNKAYQPTDAEMQLVYDLSLAFVRGHRMMVDLGWRLYQRRKGEKEVGHPDKKWSFPKGPFSRAAPWFPYDF